LVTGRLEYVGDYDNYNCAVRIDGVTGGDAGEWNCHLEEWVSGGKRGDGETTEIKYTIDVEVPTTTTTTTTTTTAAPSTYYYDEDDDDYAEDEKSTVDERPREETGSGNGRARPNRRSGNADGSMTYVVIVIAAVALLLVAVLALLWYKRKFPDVCYGGADKRWKQVDANETEIAGVEAADADQNDDADDKEKHPSIIKNGSPTVKADPTSDKVELTAEKAVKMEEKGDPEEKEALQ